MTVPTVIWVGLGGFIGASARYLVAVAVARVFAPPFPWGTVTVNLAGSLLIGIVTALAETRGMLSTEARFFLVTGVLGGFTTFSALSMETYALLRAGSWALALGSVALQLALGVSAAAIGYAFARGQ
ncbi:MAG: fluoride efflux transporter CrcB [SAR202 cluster bacterium]|nr:fluoride efflux transporter CrcB [SAR202 cluster bacterium]